MGTRAEFVKGHGTENDFVLLPDLDAALGPALDAATVRRLTDRPSGIGADGLIRVVRTEHVREVADQAGKAEWFMDYRNADGSLAEMCGNGVRVMARYLFDHGLVDGATLTLATRGGPRTVHAEPDGRYTVEMGLATLMPGVAPGADGRLTAGDGRAVTAGLGGRSWPAVPVTVPNPHAVVFLDISDDDAGARDDAGAGHGRSGPNLPVDDIETLAALGNLRTTPTLSPDSVFPEGANVEFVVARADRHIALRVWERGVGETRSCGTGVCAAAWAAMRRDGMNRADGTAYTVDVPGGRLVVTERADGELLLTGPAVLGVRGEIELGA